jgi:hypothetical protein
MKKKSALAVIPASKSINSLPATQPAPRKQDIINALVERARVKNQAKNEALQKKRQTAIDLLDTALIEELKKHPDNFERHTRPTYASPEISYRMKVIPPSLKKLQEAHQKLPQCTYFDPASVKRDIAAKLNGGITGDRVQALLANPDAVKKLDATLEALGE